MRMVQINTLLEYEDVKPNYYIREDGEVINQKTGRVLKQGVNSGGYKICNLPRVSKRKNGKVYNKVQTVHRMVALAFVDGYFESAVVNHLDEVKTNNSIDNLEWCTHSENLQYGSAQERAVKARMLSRCAKKFLSEPAKRREYVRLQAKLDIMAGKVIGNLGTDVFSKRFFLNYVKLRMFLVLTIKEEMLSMQDS